MHTIIDMFSEYGISQHLLQTVIVLIIIAGVLSVFWQQLLIGGAMLFTMMFFIAVFNTQPTTAQVASVPAQTVVEHKEVKEESKSDQDMFMEDCENIMHYTDSQCRAIWNNDEEQEKSDVKIKEQKSVTKESTI